MPPRFSFSLVCGLLLMAAAVVFCCAPLRAAAAGGADPLDLLSGLSDHFARSGNKPPSPGGISAGAGVGGAPQCDAFRCLQAGHAHSHRIGFLPESNGCGAYGFKLNSKWHEPCCDVHDRCYGTCGVTRSSCDNAFRRCMMNRCQRGKPSAEERSQCESQANMFAAATQAMGCDAYLDSQKEACECKPGGGAEKPAEGMRAEQAQKQEL